MIASAKRIRRQAKKAERQQARRSIQQALDEIEFDFWLSVEEFRQMEYDIFGEDQDDGWPFAAPSVPTSKTTFQAQYEKEYWEWVDDMEDEFFARDWEEEPEPVGSEIQ